MAQKFTPLDILLQAFPGIPQSEARDLIAKGEMHIHPPNIVLCKEDAIEAIFYIILEGRVQVTKLLSQDEVRLLKVLESGDFFGEMAIIHEAPRAATVTTLEKTTVLEIHKDTFHEILQSSASIARAMVQEVSRRLRENDAMAIEDLRLKAGELAVAYQRLAEFEYTRREFLTTISHELRTPLTSASGFLQMVQTGLAGGQALDSELMQTSLDNVSRNIQQIVSLVNDILFVQEMDLILPRFRDVDISQIIVPVIGSFRAEAQDIKIELQLEIPPDLPLISGDQKSLERAFNAIIDNAIKFSPNGGVVRVRGGYGNQYVWIQCKDNGVGIPKEAMPRIFERFFHVDKVNGQLFGGVGLGLSIARAVIEQHEGHIEVESELGKGTSLIVYLPINQKTDNNENSSV